MISTSAVLVTPALRSDAGYREPLLRLIVPATLATDWMPTASRRIWWLESRGGRRFLRGVGDILGTRIEAGDEGQGPKLLLYLDHRTCERVSWPTQREDAINVSGAFPSYGFAPLSESDERYLDEVRYGAARPISIVGAQRHFRRLWAQTVNKRKPIAESRPSAADVARYVRHYFATSELFRVDNRDPFNTAARMLCGEGSGDHAGRVCEMPCLREVPFYGPIGPRVANMAPSVEHESRPHRDASERHSFILRALAATIRQEGFVPEYNRLIDLAVCSRECDVLFEVKSTNEGTFREQARAAVGQLLEYGFQWNRTFGRDVRLAAVLEVTTSPQVVKATRAFLSAIGITLITWQRGTRGFSPNLRELIQPSASLGSRSLNGVRSAFWQNGVCDREQIPYVNSPD